MRDFTIAAAQIASMRGDVAANISAHEQAATVAAASGVSTLIFPELSLTGYEPDLASVLAFSAHDARLNRLSDAAVQHQITLVVGAPVRNDSDKPFIGAFILTPSGERVTYRKMHLGNSEVPFFAPGDTPLTLDTDGHRVGIAICADTTRPSHPQRYAEGGAGTYAAGVFLTSEWYAEDAPRLQKHAAEFGLLAVMANHGRSTGTLQSVGKSAAWAPGGALLAQASGVESALVTATLRPSGWTGQVIPIQRSARVVRVI